MAKRMKQDREKGAVQLGQALMRGRYMAAVGRMENSSRSVPPQHGSKRWWQQK
jgi:hypothetical protein